MNKDESLALLAQGREAWNAWAEERLAERRVLQEAGDWVDGAEPFDWNEATSDWRERAAVDFRDHGFDSQVDFTGFVFPGDTWAGGAIFKNDVWFGGATFKGDARFGGAVFNSYAEFDGATFKGDAGFDRAVFIDHAGFSGATFKGNARFGMAIFQRAAKFDEATLKGRTWFRGATFEDIARFTGAHFEGSVWFREATFRGDARFDLVTFDGFTNFREADFIGSASFTAAVGQSAFSLEGACFAVVPDFTQARFSEAPRLDLVRIGPWGPWAETVATIKQMREPDKNRSARWRDLKRLAVQAHDHQLEQQFFREEVRARRWAFQKPWHPSFWFGLLYQGLSNFGNSLLLPLVWLVLDVAAFSLVYLSHHAGLAGLSGLAAAWREVWTTLGWSGGTPSLGCVTGPGESAAVAAIGLSLHKALLFLGTGDKLTQSYACLYGMATYAVEEGGQTYSRVMPIIPDWVAFLGMVQLVFSTVLIFLFLLAVRNHFKIR